MWLLSPVPPLGNRAACYRCAVPTKIWLYCEGGLAQDNAPPSSGGPLDRAHLHTKSKIGQDNQMKGMATVYYPQEDVAGI